MCIRDRPVTAEVHAVTGEGLADAGATDDLERAWVEDAIRDGLSEAFAVGFASHDLFRDRVGGEFKALVGSRGTVPLAITNDGILWQATFVVDEIVLHHGPPAEAERARGAPIH